MNKPNFLFFPVDWPGCLPRLKKIKGAMNQWQVPMGTTIAQSKGVMVFICVS